jgi:GTP cyclohydrolase I
MDLGRIERAVREILIAIGEDPDRDGLRDTPGRVARAELGCQISTNKPKEHSRI